MTEPTKLLNAPKQEPGTLSRALALLGFIIILIIVVWGLIHVAQLSSPWFASLFRQAPPPATPATIVIKEPIKIAPSPKAQTAVTYSGPADLYVQIIFANVDIYGNGTAQFDIANIGGSPSGTYYFQASLPMVSGYQYSSPLQPSLNPGDHIQSTLNFTQAIQGGIISITVDPQNMVREAQEANNYTSQAPQHQYGY